LLGATYAAQGGPLFRLLAVATFIAVPSTISAVLLNIRRDRASYALLTLGGNGLIGLALLLLAEGPSSLGRAWIVGQLGYLALALIMLAWRSRSNRSVQLADDPRNGRDPRSGSGLALDVGRNS
jgi:O-antigen/teichoic acid export membrane protein